MFNVCFIVAGMDKRICFLERCIEHFKNSRYADCDIYCYFQGEKWETVKGREIFKDVVIDSKPRGVFTPRYELMKRFAKNYDYTILIDDDLYILQETDYFKSAKFIRQFNDNVIVAVSNTKVNGIVECCPIGVNIEGGMVFPRKAINAILEYFADKEMDYTFDYFWLLCYVKGFDVYRDRRSRAKHVSVRKVDGEYSGFNYSLMNKPYIPMLMEYYDNPGTCINHGRGEPRFMSFNKLNSNGKAERERNRAQLWRD